MANTVAPFTVAIVGRPNVGKSTLFNRLVGKRLALVDDLPGVTRDRREGSARLGDLRFTVIDTAGLEESAPETMSGRMRTLTEHAVKDADLTLLVIDARAGITPLDRHFAQWLRRFGGKVVLVANKTEHARSADVALGEAWSLGFGPPVAISAEHGEGLVELHEAVAKHLEPPDPAADADAAPAGPLKLAIVGRPNVGKSTLLNALIGQERMLTGPEAGLTRDAIAVAWTHKGRAIRLVDTAGLRRRAKVEGKLERLSTADTLHAIRFAEVVVLVIDAVQMLDKQDLTIARLIVAEGRAIVLAVNKWDLVTERDATMKVLRGRIDASLQQAKGLPIVTISALTGQRLDALIDAVIGAHEVWNKRIATPVLNRWLEEMVAAHSPPLVSGRRLKLRYMTQTSARPPSFALFCNRADALPDDYQRYLVNGLREAFDLPGTPIRVTPRSGDNPYATKG